jgi:hypothetical protein
MGLIFTTILNLPDFGVADKILYSPDNNDKKVGILQLFVLPFRFAS